MSSTTYEKLPLTWSLVITVLGASVVAGFYIGRITSPVSIAERVRERKQKENTTTVKDDHEDDDDIDLHAPTDSFDQYAGQEFKLVLVVRTDLGMTKGKIAAQAGHATLACYKTLTAQNRMPLLRHWERYGQAKIALKVDSEEDMLKLQRQAQSKGLVACVIHDAGRTQIASGSATVLGIGPGPKSVINEVTGHLKLL